MNTSDASTAIGREDEERHTAPLDVAPAYPTNQTPSYRLQHVDQFDPSSTPPATPGDPAARRQWATLLATDATVYGLPAVLQYGEMYVQAVETGNTRFTGFNTFSHQRLPADPTFDAFRVPTVDNLYSNAFLDLSNGPAVVHIPLMGERYYTLNFQDAYANASNLSSRTVGPHGGDFLIVAPHHWDSPPPPAARHAIAFRVASPYMWILLRVSKTVDEPDWETVNQLQDAVTVTPFGQPRAPTEFPPADPDTVRTDPATFFAALDFILRVNGRPTQEDGLTYRYRAVDLGGLIPFDHARLDEPSRAGIDDGFETGISIVSASRGRTGVPLGTTGWASSDPGRSGFDYLGRAVINLLGLGGNIAVENKPFVTHVDGAGQPLNAANARYTWHTATRPPGDDIWSLTLYEVATGQVYANRLDRYKIGSGVAGVAPAADGSFSIRIQHAEPDDTTNWLPAPAGPFFLAVRTWQPHPAALDGTWVPEPVINAGPCRSST
jgi:hypothetical protein